MSKSKNSGATEKRNFYVKTLKTYQPVEFGPTKELHNYFTSRNKKFEHLVMEYDPDMQFIHLRMGSIHRIIFPANIQFMEPQD